jgi:hypothetical protein
MQGSLAKPVLGIMILGIIGFVTPFASIYAPSAMGIVSFSFFSSILLFLLSFLIMILLLVKSIRALNRCQTIIIPEAAIFISLSGFAFISNLSLLVI